MSTPGIQHTPSPWQWRRGEGLGVWNLAPGVLVCTAGGPAGDRIDQANARLIANAPKLLMELRELCRVASNRDAAYGGDFITYLDLAVNNAQRLIATVEGRE